MSLLPSTTEILFAIGAGADVVGVTFECDHPAEARTRRIVSTSAMPEGLTPAEIDAYVVGAVARGEDLYHLSADALADLDADLVVTQDLCAVCAVDVSVVDDALAHLGCTAEVLTIDPHTLDEVFESILVLGRATGRVDPAATWWPRCGSGSRRSRARVAGLARPRVMLLEWTDPPFAPGHWIPEMISAAGGEPLLGRPGAKSRAGAVGSRSTRRHRRSIVCAPCGLRPRGCGRARGLAGGVGRAAAGSPGAPVDANAAWARPGTRLVDGIEELAAILHPL